MLFGNVTIMISDHSLSRFTRRFASLVSWGFLRAAAETRGLNGYRNKGWHRNSPAALAGTFDLESGALTTELSPLSKHGA